MEDRTLVAQQPGVLWQGDQGDIEDRERLLGPAEPLQQVSFVEDRVEIGRLEPDRFTEEAQGGLGGAAIAKDAATGAKRLGEGRAEPQGLVVGGYGIIRLA